MKTRLVLQANHHKCLLIPSEKIVRNVNFLVLLK